MHVTLHLKCATWGNVMLTRGTPNTLSMCCTWSRISLLCASNCPCSLVNVVGNLVPEWVKIPIGNQMQGFSILFFNPKPSILKNRGCISSRQTEKTQVLTFLSMKLFMLKLFRHKLVSLLQFNNFSQVMKPLKYHLPNQQEHRNLQ